MQSETDINIDAPVIGIGTNAQVPIGIGSSGNTTTIKGDLVVEGSTTLQQGAGGAVSATTLTASSTTTLNDKLTVNSNADISKNLNVFGNLNVTGNINQINSDQINVLDKNIVLASNNNNDSYINGAGLILKSNGDKKFTWNSSTASWTSTNKITAPTLDVTGAITSASLAVNDSGTIGCDADTDIITLANQSMTVADDDRC